MTVAEVALGVDVGGTFTDFVLLDEHGEIHTLKILTTPTDPSEAIFSGLDRLCASAGITPSSIDRFVHGTTLVANALIERKGAKTALITTRGFRDLLEFRTELRYDLFEPNLVFPEPLIRRSLRFEIPERMDHLGQPLEVPPREAIETLVGKLGRLGVEAVAVSLLHSYLNPDHEELVGQILQQSNPDLSVSLSSQVFREVREYERTSATAINAYVQPLVRRYLSELVDGLRQRGYRSEVLTITSTGGAVSAETAAQFPIQLIESGPAAGVVFASRISLEQAGKGEVVAFDMGGTTAKVCVIKGGQPDIGTDHEVARTRRFKVGSGLPVGVPVIHLLEIGAGGGSIAERDQTGLIRVGPRSAGAIPGPACYGLGGKEPTVTDADLVLGYLDEQAFLGGEKHIDRRAAERAIHDRIAVEASLDVVAAALAIYRIVTETMAEALRVRSVESNVDLRNFDLMAFGGAAGTHAVDIARRLSIPRIVCPARAGVFSAGGLLAAPLAVDLSRSWIVPIEGLRAEQIRSLYAELDAEAAGLLHSTGVDSLEKEHSADMSYIGQEYPLRVPFERLPETDEEVHLLGKWFEDLYEQSRGVRLNGYGSRVTTWRIRVAAGKPPLPVLAPDEALDAPVKNRPVYLQDGWTDAPVYQRRSLRVGQELLGPCVIEDVDSTFVMLAGSHLSVNEIGSLVIDAVWDGARA